MTKKEKLAQLLQPYLEADIQTEIPDEVKKGVRDALSEAENYGLYDEYIKILLDNPIIEEDPKKSYFDFMKKSTEYLPQLEIVDNDVDVYE
jgi:hypothetical protein